MLSGINDKHSIAEEREQAASPRRDDDARGRYALALVLRSGGFESIPRPVTRLADLFLRCLSFRRLGHSGGIDEPDAILLDWTPVMAWPFTCLRLKGNALTKHIRSCLDAAQDKSA